uniref:Uncharacterized protein n=1 Tax=Chenopodium quinoa TaxID=63459 RepID=A0A803MZ45_CHEQI
MKKLHLMLRKCKSLSRQLKTSSSYTSLRSNSTKECSKVGDRRQHHCDDNGETIYVGSSRRRYVIDSKYLTHPLLNALIEKSKQSPGDRSINIKCEVVLFYHLLWMLENGDPNLDAYESLDELVELYIQ